MIYTSKLIPNSQRQQIINIFPWTQLKKAPLRLELKSLPPQGVYA